MDNNDNNNLASVSFDVMNEPLISTHFIDTVMPSIPAISNNIPNASTVTTMNEFDVLNDHKNACNNVSNANTDFELNIDDLSYSVDSDEKNIATLQPTLVTPVRVEDKKCICLTPDEIMHRKSALPYKKMKLRINFSGLSAEEIDELKDDGIGNTKYTPQVYNTAKNFFTVLMHSQDPEILKYTVIVKDASGNVTYFFWVILSVNL